MHDSQRAKLACFVAIVCIATSLSIVMQRRPAQVSRPVAWQDAYQKLCIDQGWPEFGHWEQVGPFAPSLPTLEDPETSLLAGRAYRVLGGNTVPWEPMPEYLDGHVNVIRTQGIDPEFLKQHATVCLYRTITSARAITLDVFFGCELGAVMWLNSEPVLYVEHEHRFHAGDEIAQLRLRKGANHLVVKLKVSIEPCRFFFLPDFGPGRVDEALADLDRRYAIDRELVSSYRSWAETHSGRAEDRYYPLSEIPVPSSICLEGGGMDFLPDGKLAVSTRRGFVYLIANILEKDLGRVAFQRFAEGMHEGFGLKCLDHDIVVVERGALTRLRDTDGNGRADRFENLSSSWGLTGDYHEYAYGLERDHNGNWYLSLNTSHLSGALDDRGSPVPYRGWVLRVNPQRVAEPFCCGFRSPNGMGHNRDGDIFVTDNQGQWVPACGLYHLRKGCFFGHPASLRWRPGSTSEIDLQHLPDRTPPAVWFPYDELCQSASGIACDEIGGRFGPFPGQLFVGDMTKGNILRVDLDKVNDTFQGACFLFHRGCGAVNRLAFGPDGRLYLTRINRGWGGGGRGDGLARIEFSRDLPFEVTTVRLKAYGFELQFSKQIAEDAIPTCETFVIDEYSYHFWGQYGSPKIDGRALKAQRVLLAGDRKSIRLVLPPLRARHVCHVKIVGLCSSDGFPLLHDEFFYTLNVLPRT
jgi:glucose/arabinose dehydrogenase